MPGLARVRGTVPCRRDSWGGAAREGRVAGAPVALVALVACSADDGAVGSDGSLLTDADRVVTPTPAVVPPGGLVSLRFSDEDAFRELAPGERFDVVFPPGSVRPTAWRMQHEEDLGRRTGYVLYPLRGGSGPSSAPAGVVTAFTADALEGPGPDVLQVPLDAGDGAWLVCAPDEREAARCAHLEVGTPA